jgi:hypothetical protein
LRIINRNTSSNQTSFSPARIKINIRDLWTKPESKLQESTADLKALIGYEVMIEPEWQLLWTALQSHYPDPGMFRPLVMIASICGGCPSEYHVVGTLSLSDARSKILFSFDLEFAKIWGYAVFP